MNWTEIEGRWERLKGAAKAEWGRLTDDDLAQVAGRFDELVGRVATRYGIEKSHARAQAQAWAGRVARRFDSLAHELDTQDATDRGPETTPRRDNR